MPRQLATKFDPYNVHYCVGKGDTIIPGMLELLQSGAKYCNFSEQPVHIYLSPVKSALLALTY